MTPPERLRVALLLPGPSVPAWVYRVIGDVVAGEAGALALTVFDASPASPTSRLRAGAFRLYEALDRRFFRFPEDHASLVDASPLLAGCPSLTVRTLRSGAGARLAPVDVDAIRAHGPDVLLSLGFPRLEGDALGAARLGLWRFDHLDGEVAVPPFAWDVLRGAPAIETCLRAVTPAGTRVLQRSFAAADPKSLHRTRNPAIWKSASFVGRALRAAAAGRGGAEETLPASRPDAPPRAPNALEAALFASRVTARVVRDRVRARRADYRWFVALRASQGSLAHGALDGFVPVATPQGRFFADPVLVEDGGRTWLFFEDASIESEKGELRCARVLTDGSLGESRVVLERDYHLSYPFVFRREGAWYMIPETSENRTIELWRAAEFPWRWELQKVLMRGVAAVDSTLLEHRGRLWLFANLSESGGSLNDELFLFHAASLEGEWRPHPMNPVVSDVRRARSAGALFVEDGRLYRPAQDCSGEYGAAVWLHRVEVLDEERYLEVPVRRIDAGWHPGARCTHTLSRGGGFDAIDARKWVPHGAAIG